MKSSKERKHEKKRKQDEMKVMKTEKSRARRLDNKARRTEILSINSHAIIKIIDQETYVDGVRVEVINGKIIPKDKMTEEYGETFNIQNPSGELDKVEAEKGKAIDAQVEKERIGVFNPFKWIKK
tara:strand:+ start:134 stop:508 length:375 start_codon:yes stop_codon:yes gene_type:complete